MIKVTNLVRRYGDFTAVGGISFELADGEVAGFLGPNGAGKTTTIKILAGYMNASSGTVEINGMNTAENPLRCKEITGYLPENNPVYEETEVCDFLLWSGRVRGLQGDSLDSAVRKAIVSCGLETAAGRAIGQLSKGFRQRVGIACAILHNPKILLLDEPTSGLDPNQAAEMRSLINSLRAGRTILLSTHILSEAENMCDKVIIINKGLIAAQGRTAELAADFRNRKIYMLVEKTADRAAILPALQSLGAEVETADTADGIQFSLSSSDGKDLRGALFALAASNSWPVLELKRGATSLEDIFRSITA